MQRDLSESEIRAEPLPRPRVAMVRISVDGEVCAVTPREEFVAHNRDSLSDHDILELRAGRPIQVGGGAAALVTIEPVAP